MVSRESFILKHKTISFVYETTTTLSLFEVNSLIGTAHRVTLAILEAHRLGHAHSAVGDVARSP